MDDKTASVFLCRRRAPCVFRSVRDDSVATGFFAASIRQCWFSRSGLTEPGRC